MTLEHKYSKRQLVELLNSDLVQPRALVSLWQIILIILFFAVNTTQAQENDFQIWGDISAKYKINKKFRISTELGLRSKENVSQLKQNYAELGLRYKINKRFNMGVKYRFTNYFLQSKTAVHRVNLDAAYNKKWGRTRWTLRERYQHEWFVSNYKNEYYEQTLRSRLVVSYDIRKSKVEPFVAFEHYMGLNGKYQWLTTQVRYTIGADMPVNKWSDISLAYRIEPEYNKANPLTSYIFIVSWVVSLN